jgi:hypothetical protein
MPADQPERIGAYEILRTIGRGGMGVLYHARDTSRHREVALKVMSADVLEDDAARERFHHEARLAARLQHRNIVKVFEYGQDGDLPFIAMEFLRGQSLAERLAVGEPVSLATKLDIVIQVCDGLQCLHEAGVVHRDVKPSNIWLLEDGGVKLLDLGIAKHAGVSLTLQGSVVGSAAYMSPEQLAGHAVDGRADIFSAGVVLFELLSGRKPFWADSITGVMMKVLHEPAPDIRGLAPDVSADLARTVETALQKDPSKRYLEATELASDLRLARDAGDLPLPPAVQPGDAVTHDLPLETTILSAPRVVEEPAVDPDPVLRRDPGLPAASIPAPALPQRRGRGWIWAGAGLGIAAAAVAAFFLLPGGLTGEPSYVIAVRSTPPGAEISIDGAVTGRRTPADVTLGSRPSRIGLTLSGYAPVDEALAATADLQVTLEYTLQRLLQVHSQPPGARVVLDGRDTGLVTPASVTLGEPHPREVELRLDGHETAREPVSPDIVERGTMTMTLTAVPEEPPPVPVPSPAPAPTVTVTVTGAYRFSLSGCGVTQAVSQTHTVKVVAPCTLRLRAPDYFLDTMRTVTAVAGGRVELAAPPLGNVQLRSRHEDCTLLLGGRAVGSPPVDLEIAAGTYSAALQCPDGQTLQTKSFEIEAGKSTRRIDDYLR